MKVQMNRCPNCGATIAMTDGRLARFCEYCGTPVYGEEEMQEGNGRINDPEEFGYQMEMGRQRARAEWERRQGTVKDASRQDGWHEFRQDEGDRRPDSYGLDSEAARRAGTSQKGMGIMWWIIGFILLFAAPAPFHIYSIIVTIMILASKRLQGYQKVIFLILAWGGFIW